MNKLSSVSKWNLCVIFLCFLLISVGESLKISKVVRGSRRVYIEDNGDNLVTEFNELNSDALPSHDGYLDITPEVNVKQTLNEFGQDYGAKIVNAASPPFADTNNFTNFLLSQAQLYYSDTTTRKGLDIQTNVIKDLFQSGKLSTRAYALFPGTIWCGVGNHAPSDDALGFFRLTDSCCRQHDGCPATIPAGGTRYGLHNPGMFTRSHCECDKRFYKCLKQAGSIISEKIGITYFNILRPQCFRNEYPIVKCVYGFRNRCVIYVVEESQQRRWQWFDNKEF